MSWIGSCWDVIHLPDVGWDKHIEGNHRWDAQHARRGGKQTVSSLMSIAALESYVIACKVVEFSSADASCKTSQWSLISLLHCCVFHILLLLKTNKLTGGRIGKLWASMIILGSPGDGRLTVYMLIGRDRVRLYWRCCLEITLVLSPSESSFMF